MGRRIMGWENKRKIGTAYEKKAVLFLQEKGYEILESNFQCRQGEIDIIAQNGRYLVFIEVKYRQNERGGLPEEAVGREKQKKIIQTAKYYLYRKGLSEETPCRFDVVGILGEKIRLIQNAFEV